MTHAKQIPDSSHEVIILGSTCRYWEYHPDAQHTIVMIHGFSGSHEGLSDVVDQLPGYRIIAPDLPGFGDSTPMVGVEPDVASYGRFVVEFIAKLGLAQPPVLLGHSMGSLIAAHVAATQPAIIAPKLILLSPTSVSPLSSWGPRNAAVRVSEMHYQLGAKFPRVSDAWLKNALVSRATTFALMRSHDRALRQRIYRHHFKDLNYLVHKDVFSRAYRSLNRSGIIDYAAALPQSVLMIAGERDSMWPPHTQRQAAGKIGRVKLIVLPGIGHLTHFEAPVPMAREIIAFLSASAQSAEPDAPSKHSGK